MQDHLNSHEYAMALKEAADFLLSKPVFETEAYKAHIFLNMYDKDRFLNLVRSLGSITKKYTGEELQIEKTFPLGAKIYSTIPRNKVCRMVKAAQYECEPLLDRKSVV